MDNNLIKNLFSQINNAIDFKLRKITKIESATVVKVNNDTTVDIVFPHNSTVYHNIQNQSIHNDLENGDNVKVIIENGSLSNMWIIGAFQHHNRKSNDSHITKNDISLDLVYPIGAIYISVNPSNPSVLFGGKWQSINNKFLLACGNEYEAGTEGGESSHILTIKEIPSHNHNIMLNIGTDDSNFSSLSKELQGGDTNNPLLNNNYIQYTGGGAAHNNMPPYLAVYMWKRIK